MPHLDEFALIRAWTEGRQSADFLYARGVKTGIGDDAAVVSGRADADWLFTADTMVENVHFRPETMGDADVGYKALAAGVSDIAAMGGEPRLALVSVSVPPHWGAERMQALYDGLYECAERCGVAVIGGDTTSSPAHLVVSIAAIGVAPAGRALTRGMASPGDVVFVTGPLGLSAGGLHGLLDRRAPRPPQALVAAHRRPSPALAAARLLSGLGIGRALNDISDGLASEAWEIAEASGVRLVLYERSLPLSGELASYARRCGVDPLEWMLYGGEDYALVGAVRPEDEQTLRARFREAGLPLFVVGEIEQGPPGVVLERDGGVRREVRKRGYNHFPEDTKR